MSDGTRQRIKLKLGKPESKNVSPKGSRAASPARGSASASRAVSPGKWTLFALPVSNVLTFVTRCRFAALVYRCTAQSGDSSSWHYRA